MHVVCVRNFLIMLSVGDIALNPSLRKSKREDRHYEDAPSNDIIVTMGRGVKFPEKNVS